MSRTNDCGYSSEYLQRLAREKYPELVEKERAAKEAALKTPEPPAPPAPDEKAIAAARLVEVEPIDLQKAIDSGKMPLAAFPMVEVLEIARANGVKIPVGATRESLIDALKAIGVYDAKA